MVLASVDPPAAQRAMNERWHLPFRWVSDPGGERLAKPLDSWNPGERGGLFHPLVLLVAPDGREVLRQRSRDFADRTQDDAQVLDALRGLDLPPLPVPAPWDPGVAPESRPSAFRTEAFGPYFRGIRFATYALAQRMQDERDAAETRALTAVAGSFLDAWKERRATEGV